MTDSIARDAVIAEAQARISGLVDRGAHICEQFVPYEPLDSRGVSCQRCGYSAEIHLIRSLLALVSSSVALDRQTGWQPIASAPKDGTPFVAANRFDAFRAFYDVDDKVWIAEDSGMWFGRMKHPPTHWSTLPPVAEDRSTEEKE